MNRIKKNIKLLLLLGLLDNLNAQVLECRVLDHMKTGVQLAKYKFEELRSTNGTVYRVTSVNNKYNYTMFRATTDLGVESIAFSNETKYIDGVDRYFATTHIQYKNGTTFEAKLLCSDLIQLNQQRRNKGVKTSPITVQDY